ncbi:hypothetical protein [Haliscomenobacter sp.]|uniref:hypothetical protein n=1 Tax=Haliscomenobacter sp. TaxID=2717303 RepID=UPI003593E19D
MQDNLHEDLFADHAWQEMHKLLDREMPERKRRGAFWLWFLPAFGLCVLLGRDTSLDVKIPVAVEKPQQNQPAIAQVEGHSVPNAHKNSKTSPEEPISAPVSKADNKVEVIAAQVLTPGVGNLQKTGKTKLAKDKQDQQNIPAIAALTPASSDLLPPENGLNNQVSTNPPATQEEVVSISTPNVEESVRPSSEETSVERWRTSQVLATREANLNLFVAELEKPSIKPQRAKQKLEWLAETGTQLASGTTGLSGYRVGLLNAIPIGRMRLQTGLAYEKTEVGFQSIQRDAAGKENLTDVKLADVDKPALGTSVGRGNDQSVSSITLQFVNLNVSLYHPIGKRLGIALGGNLHYLGGIKLGENYLRSTLFDKAENSYQFTTNNGNFLIPQSGDLSKASFQDFGFSAQGAVSYRIATRWSASLGYRQSLQPFTKTSDLLLKPSWVDLGVRFRIK